MVPELGIKALTSTRARARPCRRFQSGRKVVTAAANAARSNSRGRGGSGRCIEIRPKTIRKRQANGRTTAPRLGQPAGPAPPEAPPLAVSLRPRAGSGAFSSLLARFGMFSGSGSFLALRPLFSQPQECPRSLCRPRAQTLRQDAARQCPLMPAGGAGGMRTDKGVSGPAT